VPYLLNLVYLALLVIVSPWLIYAALRHGKYREGYTQKLLGRVPSRQSTAGDDSSRLVWLHAVSVGEVNLLQTLVDEIGRRKPDWQCVISTTTKTGYELARRRYPQLTVFYCPLDFSWSVRTAMRRLRPDLLVLAELELWPNLIRAAHDHGTRVAIVNGRLSDQSHRGYRRIRPLLGHVLNQVDLVAAQNDETASRFLDLGSDPKSVHVTGSLKFDGAQTDRQNPSTDALRRLARLADDETVFLAGSTQPPEESLALATYRRLVVEYPQLRLVLVPRHAERFDAVADMLRESGVPFVRRSELGDSAATLLGKSLIRRGGPAVPPVLLIDIVGELGAWWGTADIGFVGGSFGLRGGQNMIEPAAYGVATSFGPNTSNFRDIVATLLSADAARVVQDSQELTTFVRRCLEYPRQAATLGGRARALVESQLGATDRTVSLLEALLADAECELSARPAA